MPWKGNVSTWSPPKNREWVCGIRLGTSRERVLNTHCSGAAPAGAGGGSVVVWCGEGVREAGELLQLRAAERFRQPSGGGGDLRIDTLQERAPRSGDRRDGAAPVGGIERPLSQSLALEAIDHARGVGRAVNAARRDFPAGVTARRRVAQDAQHAVLIGGQAVALTDLRE